MKKRRTLLSAAGNDGRKFHTLEADRVLHELQSDRNGLSYKEAKKRLEKYGRNEIRKKKRNFFIKLAPQIFDFVIILLLGIALVLAVLAYLFPDNESTSFETSIAIVSVIILSWGLIIFQMYSAERSLEALRKAAAAKARVRRDGKWAEVPAAEIVAGDIILLSEGDRVPADARIIESSNLEVDESSLTGESVSLEKCSQSLNIEDTSLHEIRNMAFMTTIVTRGNGEAVVTATGMDTELGKIATDIEEAKEPEIPLQKKMSQLARTLSVILLTLISILTLIQLGRLYLRGDLHMDSVMEQLVNAVILSVVAVPWSFPIITTTTMTRGMIHLVKDNAIIRRIASVEGLGRVSIICSDKTGTMTENAMTVRTIHLDGKEYRVTGSAYEPEGSILLKKERIISEKGSYLHRLITAAYLNNNAKLSFENKNWSVIGDPTEGALKTLGEKAGLDEEERSLKRVREVTFDSDRKMMSSVFAEEDGLTVYSKGSLESILRRSDRLVTNGQVKPLSDEMRAGLIEANSRISGRAERTLAVAYKKISVEISELKGIDDGEIESGLVFLGIVGMIDPPKKGVREAVKKCRTAGIKVVMITGDSGETASAIARDLGILEEGGRVIKGSELPVSRKVLKNVSVFCRVSPGQKVDIVNEYRKMGKIIAMTGDGMNDAAALKNADVGVAMGRSGVDVAKEASQIVLADDNFATLVTAVHRGRQIFDNIQKSITYQIYTNLSEVAIMFLGSLLFLEQMMSDKHLLFLYFSTHIFPVAALVLDRTTPAVMKEPPRDVKEGIISRRVLGRLGVMITTMAVFALSAYYLLDAEILDLARGTDKLETVQTMILTFVVSAECINLFNSLSMKDSLIKQVSERNLVLPILMALIPIGALTLLMYHLDLRESVDLVKLTPLQFIVSVASGLVIIPVVEAFKILTRRSERGR